MRLAAALAFLLLVPGSACAQPGRAAAQPSGSLTFEIERSGQPGRVQLEISRRSGNNHWSTGRTVDAASLQGLTAGQLAGDGSPVSFRIARDAGTLDCEGVVRRGRGTGDCGFVADPRFAAALAERGVGRPSIDEQFSMAMNDIGLAYVDEVRRQGYETLTAGELARAGDHGVTLDYLRGMGAHGYRVGRLSALIEMRDHGVTPDYIEALARHDVRDIPPAEIVRLRDHGVSADYVAELRELGYRRLSTEEMIQLRDHGVTADYVRTLAENGIRDIPTAELVRLRDHGVTPEFIVALRRAGYRFPPADIVTMRDHGVDDGYVRELRTLGYTDIAADEIVRMRVHGVTADFIRRANAGARRSPDELVRLRIGG